MSDVLTITFLVNLLAATVRIGIPIVYAATGEIFVERSGVLNLSIEASMLMGAFGGFAVAFYTESAWLGIGAGLFAGLLTGLVMAFFTVTLMTNQIVTGTVITIFAIGATSFGFDLVAGIQPVAPKVAILRAVPIPVLSEIPVLGPVLFSQNLLTYFGLALALLARPILYRTPWGLKVRACGENHRAAAATGINVKAVRYQTLLLGGAMAGLGGVSLTIGQIGFFTQGITAGRGFIAIAAVVFGRWEPIRTMFAALFFGLASALSIRLQTKGVAIPHQFLLMMPYVLTIVALILSVGRKLDVGTPAGPRDMGVPYESESA
jgi:simple sugar transport system permease protein